MSEDLLLDVILIFRLVLVGLGIEAVFGKDISLKIEQMQLYNKYQNNNKKVYFHNKKFLH